MKIRRSVVLVCCMVALSALPAGADPQTIDPVRQIRGEPACASQPVASAMRVQRGAVAPGEIDPRVTRLPAVPWVVPSVGEIVATLVEQGAMIAVLVFLILQSGRATLIPRSLVSAARLVRRRGAADRLGSLGE
jgi:hypothetical protein